MKYEDFIDDVVVNDIMEFSGI